MCVYVCGVCVCVCGVCVCGVCVCVCVCVVCVCVCMCVCVCVMCVFLAEYVCFIPNTFPTLHLFSGMVCNAYTLSMRYRLYMRTLKDLHLLKVATRSDSIYRDHML